MNKVLGFTLDLAFDSTPGFTFRPALGYTLGYTLGSTLGSTFSQR